MGEDKSLLPFGGFETLIEFQHNKLSTIFQDLYISSKNDKFNFPCKIIYDENLVYSPMVALKSILEILDEKQVFIISVDTPLLTEETIQKLIKKSSDANFDVTIACDKEKTHNLIGVFHNTILTQIIQMLSDDNHKINTLLTQKVHLQKIFFEDQKQFSNINTKEDYFQLSHSI